jgi:type I restriction enzyme S subunit
MVRLGEVLTQVERPEPVDPTQAYRMLGVRWYGEGLFVREEKLGAFIAANRVYAVQPGDFVYNRLFAWKGSFAVATEDLAGAHASNEFPCFAPDRSRIDSGFLLWYFRQESAWKAALGLSSGATPTSRNRLKETAFLAMEIPLPPIEEQRRIVARLGDISARIDEATALNREGRSTAALAEVAQ